MDDTVAVAVVEAAQQLHNEGRDEALVERVLAGLVQVLLEVLVDVLEGEVQAILAVLDVQQPHDVGVLPVAENHPLKILIRKLPHGQRIFLGFNLGNSHPLAFLFLASHVMPQRNARTQFLGGLPRIG